MGSNPIDIDMHLDGDRLLKELCDELPRRMVEKGLTKAATAAGTPLTRAYRSQIDSRSGVMKKAVKKKVKLYREQETAIALVGVDRNVIGSFQGRKVWPLKYQHLLEIGVRPHTIQRGNVIINHPGIQGRHYLQKAQQAAGEESLNAANTKLKETLEAEAAKLSK